MQIYCDPTAQHPYIAWCIPRLSMQIYCDLHTERALRTVFPPPTARSLFLYGKQINLHFQEKAVWSVYYALTTKVKKAICRKSNYYVHLIYYLTTGLAG